MRLPTSFRVVRTDVVVRAFDAVEVKSVEKITFVFKRVNASFYCESLPTQTTLRSNILIKTIPRSNLLAECVVLDFVELRENGTVLNTVLSQRFNTGVNVRLSTITPHSTQETQYSQTQSYNS